MKTFIVTGATKGIGLAIAKALRLKYEGCTLYITYAHDNEAAESCRRILSNGITYVDKVDMSSYESTKDYCEKLRNMSISIDGLILNAGIGYKASLDDLDINEWERIMRCNLNVPILMIKELVRSFSREGSIILAGSMMGKYPHSGSLAYGVSKAGVHALVRNMPKFLEKTMRGVRINAVAPGFTLSEWHANKPKEFFEHISTKISVHRWAECEEIADAYIFLLENKYMNGAVLDINGGYSYF